MKTKRTRGQSLTRIVADLNPMLKVWLDKHAHPYTFEALDGFVRRGLRAILHKQGRGAGLADASLTINAGPMPSSRRPDSSVFTRLGLTRDTPDEGTND
ncbi:hypothetical protein KUL72_30710 [Bradyrhizobium arachidis]|uniref:hypothetical protein n=1 Tax=Bradyrhizobium arachidis TaxID=858423 RepID=UPI0022004E90|nr:hypothetical protein KUL72_30710 [Bradyrhizobium arachidis]